MPISDAERDSLVRLLAARLPAWGARADVARAAGLGDVQLTGSAGPVWGALVDEAIARDSLGALLTAAARLRAEDPELGAIARSAADGALVVPHVDDNRAWIRGALIASAVVIALGIGALGYDLLVGTESANVDAVLTPTVPVLPGGEGSDADPAAASGTSTAAEPDPAPSVAPEPSAAVAPEPPTPPPDSGSAAADAARDTPPDVAPTEASPSSTAGPCSSPAGQVVGYAYAGESSPGSAGQVWTVPRGINVRADHPRRENGWNARTRVVCVLPRGARVRLTEAPVAVAGGAWWVPIQGGSVETGSH